MGGTTYPIGPRMASCPRSNRQRRRGRCARRNGSRWGPGSAFAVPRRAHVRFRARRLAGDELIEGAHLAILRLFLVEEREPRFIEFFEELIPSDFFEILVVGVARIRK